MKVSRVLSLVYDSRLEIAENWNVVNHVIQNLAAILSVVGTVDD